MWHQFCNFVISCWNAAPSLISSALLSPDAFQGPDNFFIKQRHPRESGDPRPVLAVIEPPCQKAWHAELMPHATIAQNGSYRAEWRLNGLEREDIMSRLGILGQFRNAAPALALAGVVALPGCVGYVPRDTAVYETAPGYRDPYYRQPYHYEVVPSLPTGCVKVVGPNNDYCYDHHGNAYRVDDRRHDGHGSRNRDHDGWGDRNDRRGDRGSSPSPVERYQAPVAPGGSGRFRQQGEAPRPSRPRSGEDPADSRNWDHGRYIGSPALR